jgi:hypothetical protein
MKRGGLQAYGFLAGARALRIFDGDVAANGARIEMPVERSGNWVRLNAFEFSGLRQGPAQGPISLLGLAIRHALQLPKLIGE